MAVTGLHTGKTGKADLVPLEMPPGGDGEVARVPPAFFVHGYGSIPAHSTVFRRRLRKKKVEVYTDRLPWMAMGNIVRSAEVVARQIEELKEDLGLGKLNLIGHSLGGIIIRYYLQQMEGWKNVKRVVYMCTPFYGTYLAYLAPMTKAGRQLHPGSGFLRCMEQDTSRCRRPRCLSIYSMLDYVTIPHSSCHLECAYNKKVWLPAGHVSLLLSKRAAGWTADFLQEKTGGLQKPVPGEDGREIAC